MKNLPVPYKSQWDEDAGMTNNDCGPTSIAMILNYYGENLTTNQVFEKTGAGQGLISWPQLQKAITALGYKSTLERGGSLNRLKQLIDSNTPVIILVHYGSLNSTQDKSFKGGHFFTVVGYNADGFFVNDSNFKGTLRKDGDHHNYLNAELDKAWKDCTIDGNQPYSLLFIERKTTVVAPLVNDQFKIDYGSPHGILEVQQVKGLLGDLIKAKKEIEDRKIYELELEKKLYEKEKKVEDLFKQLQTPTETIAQEKIDMLKEIKNSKNWWFVKYAKIMALLA